MDATSTERRREMRRRALLGGHVVMNNRSSTLDCLVRSLAEHGARLQFGGTPWLPEEFELRIDGRNMRRKARKVWMRDGEMGVELG
ncbi:MAG: hypothetical protein OEL76_06910 [Siculibacillus sp.]|nr:hypothetical protein [Siculibacillus sp.]